MLPSGPSPEIVKVPVTVAVPAHNRVQSLLRVLDSVKACRPVPAEILVHVDGTSQAILDAVAEHHPDVILLSTAQLVGPGGGRDALIRAATHPLVATFDDDSHPEFGDFFARVVSTFDAVPNLAVLAANVLPEPAVAPSGLQRMAEFIGCGCVFQKSWYLRTTGFVPRPVAYGMEEADISLQLHSLGGLVLRDAGLRVVHHRESHERFGRNFHEEVTINTIMLPFLRYPWPLFPLVIWHLFARLVWEARSGWGWAAVVGTLRSPATLLGYCSYRKPVSARSVISWHRLKRSTPAAFSQEVPAISAPAGRHSASFE